MNKRLALVVASLLFFSNMAFAQFSGSMSASQVETAVRQQTAQNKTPADIARTALAAGVPAGTLTTGMLVAGVNATSAIVAIISAGGDPSAVVTAAIAAGVPANVVSAAALQAGANPAVVQAAIDAATTQNLARSNTPSPAGPTSSAGGGTRSGR